MAVTLAGVGCAENFSDVAVFGATYEDPIIEGIGCIPQSRLNDTGAGAVTVAYLAPEATVYPAATPLPYASSASADSGAIKQMSNTLKTIVLNNFYDDAIGMPGQILDSVPYDAAADNITLLSNKASRENLNMEVGCLINEGTSSKYTLVGTETAAEATEIKWAQCKKAIYDMKGTNFKPRFALVSQEIYDKVVAVAGNAFTGDVRNEIAFTGDIGRYNGIIWAATPVLGKTSGSVKYIDNGGTTRTVSVAYVDAIFIDGDYFAAINRISGLALKDGGAYQSGVVATMDRAFGATLLNDSAAYVVSKNS